jgi:TPR repeat protein
MKAQCNLGVMLRYGNGTPQDFEEAARWYIRSAEAGYFRAQATLAAMYLNGEGLERDALKAAFWYTRAAENGSSRGMYNLGLMYSEGTGVEKDITKAERLFREAVSKGYSKAMFALGEMLMSRGEEDAALELFVSGASKGEPRCISALGSRGLPIPEYTGRMKRRRS